MAARPRPGSGGCQNPPGVSGVCSSGHLVSWRAQGLQFRSRGVRARARPAPVQAACGPAERGQSTASSGASSLPLLLGKIAPFPATHTSPTPSLPPPPFCYSSPRDTVTHEVGHPGVLHALCENGKLDRKQPFQGRHAGDQERMSKTKSMSDLCLLSGNLCQARRADRQVRLFGKYPQ